MRVLAAIVVPPHLSISGGAKAGEALSEALGPHCRMSVATMLGGNGFGRSVGRSVEHLPVRTYLPFGLAFGRVPRQVRSPLYRSDIPEIVRAGRFDLVHLHNPMPALEMARIAEACRRAGIPYVVSTHGFNEIVNGRTIYRFGPLRRAAWARLVVDPVRRVVAGASEIFALSPADLPLLAALGHAQKPVTIVPNGVDPPDARDAGDDALLLAGLGLAARAENPAATFFFLANHTPNKGLVVLFEALRSIKRPYQVILGGERRPGIPYDEARAACGPNQSLVVTGRLSDAQTAACFRRADGFVFPTLADTFPLVVLEAMAHGLPVIASRVGGIPHQLRNDCGILVEPNDPAALARAMTRLIDDPPLAARLAASAKARAASDYSWERAAEIAFARYERILAAAPFVAKRTMTVFDALQRSPT